MSANDAVLVGWSDKAEILLLNWANRHGVVAGATGTGKTVTFSQAGRQLIRGVLGSLLR